MALTLIVGTHTMDEVDSYVSGTPDGDYEFTPEGEDVRGEILATRTPVDVPLPDLTVRLLESQESPGFYSVMVSDPWWGVRIAPYPPVDVDAEEGFVQDFTLGYTMRVQFELNGTPTNGEGLVLMLRGTMPRPDNPGTELVWDTGSWDETQWAERKQRMTWDVSSWNKASWAMNSSLGALVWEYLWPGSEFAPLKLDGSDYVPDPDDRDYALLTKTISGVVGCLSEQWPSARDWIIVPSGHGAIGQRVGVDYRDDSTETATATDAEARGVTEAFVYYLGAEFPLLLDESLQVVNYAQATVRIYGTNAEYVAHYKEGAEAGWQPTPHHGSWQIGGTGILTKQLDAGQYGFAGYTYAGSPTYRYPQVTDGLVQLDVDWGEEYDVILPPLVDSWEHGGGGKHRVLVTRGRWPAEDVRTWWWEQWEGVYTWFYKDVSDEEGRVYWEECFVDPSTRSCAWARFYPGTQGIFPIINLHAHMATEVQWPGIGGEFVPGIFCGHEETTFYNNLRGLQTGAYVRPRGDFRSRVEQDYWHVPVIKERGSNRMTTQVALPALEMQELWAQGWFEDDSTNPNWDHRPHWIVWELMSSDDEVLTEFQIPTGGSGQGATADFVVNVRKLDQMLGSRIKGSALEAAWSSGIIWSTEYDASRQGAEFGNLPEKPLDAVAIPIDTAVEEVVKIGVLATECSYCGCAGWILATDAKQYYCPQCDVAGYTQHNTEDYWQTPPVSLASEAVGSLVDHYEMWFRHWPITRLAPMWYRFRGHYRGQCYNEDAGHEGYGPPSGSPAPRFWQDHVDFGDWDHAGGFTDGNSVPDHAATEGPVGRAIGPVQPKLEVTEVLLANQEFRLSATRTDGSSVYFYGTIRAYPTDDVGDIITFAHVLEDTTDDETERRARQTVYHGDGLEWPTIPSDVIWDVTAVEARDPDPGDPDEPWEDVADWLSQGSFEVIHDSPAYQWHKLLTKVANWRIFLAHLEPEALRYVVDLRVDRFGRCWVGAVDDEGLPVVAWFGHSTAALTDWVFVTLSGSYSHPSIVPMNDGRIVLAVHDEGTEHGALFLSKDSGVSWEAIAMAHLADDLDMPDLALEPYSNNIYAVGIDAAAAWIEWSDDGGDSKKLFQDGTSYRKKIVDLTVASGVYTQASIECMLDATLRASTVDDAGTKFWKSRDRGNTWSQVT